MPKQNQISLRCDLCKWPPETFAGQREAAKAGWLIIGQEGYYTDRDFFDSVVCPSCAAKVLAAAGKQGKTKKVRR